MAKLSEVPVLPHKTYQPTLCSIDESTAHDRASLFTSHFLFPTV